MRRPRSHQLLATCGPDVPSRGHLRRAFPSSRQASAAVRHLGCLEQGGCRVELEQRGGLYCEPGVCHYLSRGAATWAAESIVDKMVFEIVSVLLELSCINPFLEGGNLGVPYQALGAHNFQLQIPTPRPSPSHSSCQKCPAHSCYSFSQQGCHEHILYIERCSGHQKDSSDQNRPSPPQKKIHP